MKYYRNATHVEMLRKDYENEIKNVKKMLETEDDLRVRALHQQTLYENMEALKHLDEFLENNQGLFK